MKQSRKWIALVTVVAFLFTSLYSPNGLMAQTTIQDPLPDLTSLRVSSEIASLQEVFISPDKKAPFVVAIQDAHGIYEAQKNIRAIIQELQDKYSFTLTTLEGGAGKGDYTLFRTFPNPAVNQNQADWYLKRAEISGGEMAAMTNPKEGIFYGVEDRDFYFKNRESFLKGMALKTQNLHTLILLGRKLDQIRDKIYPQKLLVFDQKEKEYRKERLGLIDFLAVLEKYAGEEGIPLEPTYPDLALIFKTKADNSKNLSQEEVKVKEKELAAQIEGKKLFQEIRDLSQTIKSRYFHPPLKLRGDRGVMETEGNHNPTTSPYLNGSVNPDDIQTLDSLYSKLWILEKLVSLEVTKDDLSVYSQEKEAFGIQNFSEFLKKYQDSIDLTLDLKPAEIFYEEALKRDGILYENLKTTMKKEKTERAIIVAGGFHTEGLRDKFRKDGLSYVILSPRIERIPEENPYYKVMEGEVSYRKTSRSQIAAPLVTLGMSQETAEQFAEVYFEKGLRGLLAELKKDPNFRQEWQRLGKEWQGRIISTLKFRDPLADPSDLLAFVEVVMKAAASQPNGKQRIEAALRYLEDTFSKTTSGEAKKKIDAYLEGVKVLNGMLGDRQLRPLHLSILFEGIRRGIPASKLPAFVESKARQAYQESYRSLLTYFDGNNVKLDLNLRFVKALMLMLPDPRNAEALQAASDLLKGTDGIESFGPDETDRFLKELEVYLSKFSPEKGFVNSNTTPFFQAVVRLQRALSTGLPQSNSETRPVTFKDFYFEDDSHGLDLVAPASVQGEWRASLTQKGLGAIGKIQEMLAPVTLLEKGVKLQGAQSLGAQGTGGSLADWNRRLKELRFERSQLLRLVKEPAKADEWYQQYSEAVTFLQEWNATSQIYQPSGLFSQSYRDQLSDFIQRLAKLYEGQSQNHSARYKDLIAGFNPDVQKEFFDLLRKILVVRDIQGEPMPSWLEGGGRKIVQMAADPNNQALVKLGYLNAEIDRLIKKAMSLGQVTTVPAVRPEIQAPTHAAQQVVIVGELTKPLKDVQSVQIKPVDSGIVYTLSFEQVRDALQVTANVFEEREEKTRTITEVIQALTPGKGKMGLQDTFMLRGRTIRFDGMNLILTNNSPDPTVPTMWVNLIAPQAIKAERGVTAAVSPAKEIKITPVMDQPFRDLVEHIASLEKVVPEVPKITKEELVYSETERGPPLQFVQPAAVSSLIQKISPLTLTLLLTGVLASSSLLKAGEAPTTWVPRIEQSAQPEVSPAAQALLRKEAEKIVGRLLDRANFPEPDFEMMREAGDIGPSIKKNYVDISAFRAGQENEAFRSVFTDAVTLALANDSLRLSEVLAYIDHVVFTRLPEFMQGNAKGEVKTILFNIDRYKDPRTIGVAEQAQLGRDLIIAMVHEGRHNANLGKAEYKQKPGKYDFKIGAKDELSAYQETVHWMKKLGYPQGAVDTMQWVVDRIPDKDLVMARYVTAQADPTTGEMLKTKDIFKSLDTAREALKAQLQNELKEKAPKEVAYLRKVNLAPGEITLYKLGSGLEGQYQKGNETKYFELYFGAGNKTRRVITDTKGEKVFIWSEDGKNLFEMKLEFKAAPTTPEAKALGEEAISQKVVETANIRLHEMQKEIEKRQAAYKWSDKTMTVRWFTSYLIAPLMFALIIAGEHQIHMRGRDTFTTPETLPFVFMFGLMAIGYLVLSTRDRMKRLLSSSYPYVLDNLNYLASSFSEKVYFKDFTERAADFYGILRNMGDPGVRILADDKPALARFSLQGIKICADAVIGADSYKDVKKEIQNYESQFREALIKRESELKRAGQIVYDGDKFPYGVPFGIEGPVDQNLLRRLGLDNLNSPEIRELLRIWEVLGHLSQKSFYQEGDIKNVVIRGRQLAAFMISSRLENIDSNVIARSMEEAGAKSLGAEKAGVVVTKEAVKKEPSFVQALLRTIPLAILPILFLFASYEIMKTPDTFQRLAATSVEFPHDNSPLHVIGELNDQRVIPFLKERYDIFAESKNDENRGARLEISNILLRKGEGDFIMKAAMRLKVLLKDLDFSSDSNLNEYVLTEGEVSFDKTLLLSLLHDADPEIQKSAVFFGSVLGLPEAQALLREWFLKQSDDESAMMTYLWRRPFRGSRALFTASVNYWTIRLLKDPEIERKFLDLFHRVTKAPLMYRLVDSSWANYFRKNPNHQLSQEILNILTQQDITKYDSYFITDCFRVLDSEDPAWLKTHFKDLKDFYVRRFHDTAFSIATLPSWEYLSAFLARRFPDERAEMIDQLLTDFSQLSSRASLSSSELNTLIENTRDALFIFGFGSQQIADQIAKWAAGTGMSNLGAKQMLARSYLFELRTRGWNEIATKMAFTRFLAESPEDFSSRIHTGDMLFYPAKVSWADMQEMLHNPIANSGYLRYGLETELRNVNRAVGAKEELNRWNPFGFQGRLYLIYKDVILPIQESWGNIQKVAVQDWLNFGVMGLALFVWWPIVVSLLTYALPKEIAYLFKQKFSRSAWKNSWEVLKLHLVYFSAPREKRVATLLISGGIATAALIGTQSVAMAAFSGFFGLWFLPFFSYRRNFEATLLSRILDDLRSGRAPPELAERWKEWLKSRNIPIPPVTEPVQTPEVSVAETPATEFVTTAQSLGQEVQKEREILKFMVVPSLVTAYQEGGLPETVSFLSSHYTKTYPHIAAMLNQESSDVITQGLEATANEVVRQKVASQNFEYLNEGNRMVAFISDDLPSVIVKKPKDEVNFKEDVLPGYRLAKSRLGELFASMILTDVPLKIDGQVKFEPYVIVQERVRLLGHIFENYEERIMKAQSDEEREKLAVDYEKLVDSFMDFQRQMFRRGVFDADFHNMPNNYGIRVVGSSDFVGIDVDHLTREWGRFPYHLDLSTFPVGTPRQEYYWHSIDRLVTGEQFKPVHTEAELYPHIALRVPDPFTEDVKRQQAAYLIQRFNILEKAATQEDLPLFRDLGKDDGTEVKPFGSSLGQVATGKSLGIMEAPVLEQPQVVSVAARRETGFRPEKTTIVESPFVDKNSPAVQLGSLKQDIFKMMDDAIGNVEQMISYGYINADAKIDNMAYFANGALETHDLDYVYKISETSDWYRKYFVFSFIIQNLYFLRRHDPKDRLKLTNAFLDKVYERGIIKGIVGSLQGNPQERKARESLVNLFEERLFNRDTGTLSDTAHNDLKEHFHHVFEAPAEAEIVEIDALLTSRHAYEKDLARLEKRLADPKRSNAEKDLDAKRLEKMYVHLDEVEAALATHSDIAIVLLEEKKEKEARNHIAEILAAADIGAFLKQRTTQPLAKGEPLSITLPDEWLDLLRADVGKIGGGSFNTVSSYSQFLKVQDLLLKLSVQVKPPDRPFVFGNLKILRDLLKKNESEIIQSQGKRVYRDSLDLLNHSKAVLLLNRLAAVQPSKFNRNFTGKVIKLLNLDKDRTKYFYNAAPRLNREYKKLKLENTKLKKELENLRGSLISKAISYLISFFSVDKISALEDKLHQADAELLQKGATREKALERQGEDVVVIEGDYERGERVVVQFGDGSQAEIPVGDLRREDALQRQANIYAAFKDTNVFPGVIALKDSTGSIIGFAQEEFPSDLKSDVQNAVYKAVQLREMLYPARIQIGAAHRKKLGADRIFSIKTYLDGVMLGLRNVKDGKSFPWIDPQSGKPVGDLLIPNEQLNLLQTLDGLTEVFHSLRERYGLGEYETDPLARVLWKALYDPAGFQSLADGSLAPAHWQVTAASLGAVSAREKEVMRDYAKRLEPMIQIPWRELPRDTREILIEYGVTDNLIDLDKEMFKTYFLLFTSIIPELAKTFTLKKLKTYWPDLLKYANESRRQGYNFLRIGLPAYKDLIETPEDFRMVAQGLITLRRSANHPRDFFEQSFVALRKTFTLKQIKTYWPDIVELSKASGWDVLKLFQDGFPRLKETFADADEFKAYWPTLVEIGKRSGDSTTFFTSSIPDLKEIFTQEEFNRYWPGIFELAKTSGTSVNDLLIYGIPALKKAFGPKRFEASWKDLVEIGKASGTKSAALFGDLLPEIKGWIKTQEGMAQLREYLLSPGEPTDLKVNRLLLVLEIAEGFGMPQNSMAEVLGLAAKLEKMQTEIKGKFNINSRNHLAANYFAVRWQEMLKSETTLLTVENYKEMIKEASKYPPETIPFYHEVQLKALSYEAYKLAEYLLRLKERAGKEGRGVVLVANKSYGTTAIAPIREWLVGNKIPVIETKIGSTDCHEDPSVIDFDDRQLFTNKQIAEFVNQKPYVVVVDGSYSLDPQRVGQFKRQNPRFPDAYQGYRNFFIALNEGMKKEGVEQDMEQFQKDADFLDQLKDVAKFARIAKKAEESSSVKTNELYRMRFWTPAFHSQQGKLKFSEKRSIRQDRAPPIFDVDKAAPGPALIFVESAIENRNHPLADPRNPTIPASIYQWMGGEHNPAFFDDDDKQLFKYFQYEFVPDFGLSKSNRYTRVSQTYLSEIGKLLGKEIAPLTPAAGRSLGEMGMGMGMSLSQEQRLEQRMEQRQELRLDQRLLMTMEQKMVSTYESLEKEMPGVMYAVSQRDGWKRFSEWGLDFVYMVVHKGDYIADGGFQQWLDNAGGGFVHYSESAGGQIIRVVDGDRFPPEFIELIAVHEYAEGVLHSHLEATRMEFTAAQRKGMSNAYIHWLVENHPVKFANVFTVKEYYDRTYVPEKVRKSKKYIAQMKKGEESGEKAHLQELIKGFTWPTEVRQVLEKAEASGSAAEAIFKKAFENIRPNDYTRLPSNWRKWLEVMENSIRQAIIQIKKDPKIEVRYLNPDLMRQVVSEELRAVDEVLAKKWNEYRELDNDRAMKEITDGLPSPFLRDFGIFRTDINDLLRSSIAKKAVPSAPAEAKLPVSKMALPPTAAAPQKALDYQATVSAFQKNNPDAGRFAEFRIYSRTLRGSIVERAYQRAKRSEIEMLLRGGAIQYEAGDNRLYYPESKEADIIQELAQMREADFIRGEEAAQAFERDEPHFNAADYKTYAYLGADQQLHEMSKEEVIKALKSKEPLEIGMKWIGSLGSGFLEYSPRTGTFRFVASSLGQLSDQEASKVKEIIGSFDALLAEHPELKEETYYFQDLKKFVAPWLELATAEEGVRQKYFPWKKQYKDSVLAILLMSYSKMIHYLDAIRSSGIAAETLTEDQKKLLEWVKVPINGSWKDSDHEMHKSLFHQSTKEFEVSNADLYYHPATNDAGSNHIKESMETSGALLTQPQLNQAIAGLLEKNITVLGGLLNQYLENKGKDLSEDERQQSEQVLGALNKIASDLGVAGASLGASAVLSARRGVIAPSPVVNAVLRTEGEKFIFSVPPEMLEKIRYRKPAGERLHLSPYQMEKILDEKARTIEQVRAFREYLYQARDTYDPEWSFGIELKKLQDGGDILEVGPGHDLILINFLINDLGFDPKKIYAIDPDMMADPTLKDPAFTEGRFAKGSIAEPLPDSWKDVKFNAILSFHVFPTFSSDQLTQAIENIDERLMIGGRVGGMGFEKREVQRAFRNKFGPPELRLGDFGQFAKATTPVAASLGVVTPVTFSNDELSLVASELGFGMFAGTAEERMALLRQLAGKMSRADLDQFGKDFTSLVNQNISKFVQDSESSLKLLIQTAGHLSRDGLDLKVREFLAEQFTKPFFKNLDEASRSNIQKALITQFPSILRGETVQTAAGVERERASKAAQQLYQANTQSVLDQKAMALAEEDMMKSLFEMLAKLPTKKTKLIAQPGSFSQDVSRALEQVAAARKAGGADEVTGASLLDILVYYAPSETGAVDRLKKVPELASKVGFRRQLAEAMKEVFKRQGGEATGFLLPEMGVLEKVKDPLVVLYDGSRAAKELGIVGRLNAAVAVGLVLAADKEKFLKELQEKFGYAYQKQGKGFVLSLDLKVFIEKLIALQKTKTAVAKAA